MSSLSSYTDYVWRWTEQKNATVLDYVLGQYVRIAVFWGGGGDLLCRTGSQPIWRYSVLSLFNVVVSLRYRPELPTLVQSLVYLSALSIP